MRNPDGSLCCTWGDSPNAHDMGCPELNRLRVSPFSSGDTPPIAMVEISRAGEAVAIMSLESARNLAISIIETCYYAENKEHL